LLDCMVVLFLVFWRTSILLSIVVILIYIPTNSVWGFIPHPYRCHLSLFVFLMIDILTRVRWNLNVVLTCISFMTKNAEHFFMYLLAFVLLPLKNFCLVLHLPIYFFIGSLILWEFRFLSSL
jgi:hypothetical protein